MDGNRCILYDLCIYTEANVAKQARLRHKIEKETEGSLENMSATCLDKVAVADVSSRQLPLFAVLLKQSNAQQKLGTL